MDSVAESGIHWQELTEALTARIRSQQNHGQYFTGHAGLTGGSCCNHTHNPTPATTPNPPYTTGAELMIPPPAAVAAPAPCRRFFFFFSVSVVSSRVVCCPCVTVVVPLSSCTVTQPLLAAI